MQVHAKGKALAILAALALFIALSGFSGTSFQVPYAHGAQIQCGGLSSSDAQQISSQTPWYCPINNQIYDEWKGAAGYAFAAVALAFTIAGLLIMIGIATRSGRIREFGTGELYEAAASAIIVVLFLYVCAVLFGLVPAFVVGPINPYATAFNLMTSTIHQAEVMYNSLYQANLVDTFYASTSVTLQHITVSGGQPSLSDPIELFIPEYATTLQLLYIQPMSALTDFISDAVVVVYGEYYLLVFFSVAAIPVFLVPGVIFRAILPTRALGGILVALAMGFYLIMPTLFAVAYYFTAPTALQQLSTLNLQFNRYAQGSGLIDNAVTPTSPLVQNLQSVSSAMSSFWLLILFYPMLIIATTYAFVDQIAHFIGGAYRGVGRIRMFV